LYSRLSKLAHTWLDLVLEESVVQFLIVDIDLAHLRLDALPCLLLERLIGFLGFYCVALLPNTGIGDPCYRVSAWVKAGLRCRWPST
jgi:hypothetical protein